MFSGMFGAMIGTPFDVALVRRQASVSTGKNMYRNTFHAFQTIIKEEGVLGLWTGIRVAVIRVMIVNFGQLAIRDIVQE
ncbi:unnamed protein product [Sphagnum balticum]